MSESRKAYKSDVSDAEWEFLAPYLTLMREDAPQREHALRDVFDALRYVVKTGCQWDMLPHDLPPWSAVYQQARRWVRAGVANRFVQRVLAVGVEDTAGVGVGVAIAEDVLQLLHGPQRPHTPALTP